MVKKAEEGMILVCGLAAILYFVSVRPWTAA
jgi:hypothetical protein